MRKNNEELQREVQDAIKWESLLNAAEIGVIAKDGVVTLTGMVDGLLRNQKPKMPQRKLQECKAVVENIEIKFDGVGKKTDNEIANEIINALKWNWSVPNDKVKVKVEDGWVTLEGELEWNSQKEAAKKAVSNLLGVRFVSNILPLNLKYMTKSTKGR